MSTHLLRVVWPILDEQTPLRQIAQEVADDLPVLAARTHARITGAPKFWTAPASRVPGSGGLTRWVLICEAPAIAVPARIYRQAPA